MGDILSISKSGLTYIIANLPGPTQTIIPELVVVTNTEISEPNSNTAIVSGIITGDGGGINERGICWSTVTNPTLTDSHTSNGTGAGEFAGTLDGLEPGGKNGQVFLSPAPEVDQSLKMSTKT